MEQEKEAMRLRLGKRLLELRLLSEVPYCEHQTVRSCFEAVQSSRCLLGLRGILQIMLVHVLITPFNDI